MSKNNALSTLEELLSSNKSSEEKAAAIIGLSRSLRDSACEVLQQGLEGASALVQVALMDAYFEVTSSRLYMNKLEDIINDTVNQNDNQEQLYMAARLALGRVNGLSMDSMDMWGDGELHVSAMAQRRRGERASVADEITIMIHGTWASDGQWWRPKGDFFEYVKSDLGRADLYGKSDQFKWSGKNRDRKRKQAAAQLSTWIKKHPAANVNVFAHSHGANVAMLASHKTRLNRLVMLSPPVRRDYYAKWKNVAHAYNIQAAFDPVVAIARGGQTFHLKKVKEKTLKASGHSASHDPTVWKDEKLANFIEIQQW